MLAAARRGAVVARSSQRGKEAEAKAAVARERRASAALLRYAPRHRAKKQGGEGGRHA